MISSTVYLYVDPVPNPIHNLNHNKILPEHFDFNFLLKLLMLPLSLVFRENQLAFYFFFFLSLLKGTMTFFLFQGSL